MKLTKEAKIAIVQGDIKKIKDVKWIVFERVKRDMFDIYIENSKGEKVIHITDCPMKLNTGDTIRVGNIPMQLEIKLA